MQVEDIAEEARNSGFAFVEWVKGELDKTSLSSLEKAKIFMLVRDFCAMLTPLLFAVPADQAVPTR